MDYYLAMAKVDDHNRMVSALSRWERDERPQGSFGDGVARGAQPKAEKPVQTAPQAS